MGIQKNKIELNYNIKYKYIQVLHKLKPKSLLIKGKYTLYLKHLNFKNIGK